MRSILLPVGEVYPAEVESLEDAEERVNPEEEVVVAHLLDVNEGHDELLVLVLLQLLLQGEQGGGQDRLHHRVGKVSQPPSHLPWKDIISVLEPICFFSPTPDFFCADSGSDFSSNKKLDFKLLLTNL